MNKDGICHQEMTKKVFKIWIISWWSANPYLLPTSQFCNLSQPWLSLYNFPQNSCNQRMDINVRTLFSLSAFLAEGVLFSFRSSSITTFSTVSMLCRSFFCGVTRSASPLFWWVISSNIFGTLPMKCLFENIGFGEIIVSRALGVLTWSWRIGLSVRRPSPSPPRSLLLSIA